MLFEGWWVVCLEIPLDAATWVVNKENSIKQEMRTYKTVEACTLYNFTPT